MEFRIVAGEGQQAAVYPGKATYSAEKALRILRDNPGVMAEDIKTGERHGLADLEQLIAGPRNA